MSSSEIETCPVLRVLRAPVAARGLRGEGALPAGLPADFGGAFALADLTGFAVTAAPDAALSGAADPFPGTAASLDFFEFFTIYFCFGTAKPLPTADALASRNRLARSSFLDETFCYQMGNHDRGRHGRGVPDQRHSL